MAKVLLVDDDAAFSDATSQLLTLLGHNVDVAGTVAQAREQLRGRAYDRIFLDLMLPDGSGFHVLESLVPGADQPRVTIITGHPSVKNHVMSLYGMNVNYLVKPLDLQRIKRLFEDDVRSEASERHFGQLVGESGAMRSLYRQIERVAPTPANVMLMGESGVGKEMVARAIHYASKAAGHMVAANCGALSSELIGSELFGHEKGAFTGAVARKSGLFEQADNSTLFLDEITEMPLSLQPNLLRVLETQMVTRVGGIDAFPVNCRVISATNRTERQLYEENCLREDLYYRLAVFPIYVPPLRERMDDIPLLAGSFLQYLNRENGTSLTVGEEAMKRLMAYEWPGNVRELRHVIQRAYIMTEPDADTLALPSHFSSPFSRQRSPSVSSDLIGKTIEEVERELIAGTLKQFENNKKKAAEVLGVSVKTLYNRLNAYGEDNEVTGISGSSWPE